MMGKWFTGTNSQQWRGRAAACLGLNGGYQLSHFLTNTFAPQLLAEISWPKSQFAPLGLSVISVMVSLRL